MARTKTQKETKIRIKLKSYDSRIIDLSCAKIVDTAIRTGAKIVGPVPLPTKIERFTVLNPTSSTIETLSKLSLPAGVGISIKM